MIYKWKEGARFSVPAQAAGEHIAKMGQTVTARAVVDDAKSKRSPLHLAFEWDNAVAADQYRLEQARLLLRCLVMVIHSDTEQASTTRAFLQITEEEGRAYMPTLVVMASPPLRAQVLARALRELDSWRERYHELEELSQIFAASEHVREEIAV